MAAKRTGHTQRTPKKRDWQAAFLKALSTGLTVTKAAEAAAISRRNAYDERARNAEFAHDWDDIVERTTEIMEIEAYRRAVEGWVEREEFETDKETGERVPTLTVRKYSDTLLIFLLKSRRPGVYRERHTVEHTGSVEQRVRVDLRKLTDEQLAALEAIQPDES